MGTYKTYETERLILSPTGIEDANFIYKLMNTDKWLKFIGDRKIKSVMDAKKYIELKMLPQLERLGYSNYTVSRKEDQCKLGVCGLYDRDGLEGIDIGFAFLPAFEGKGYAYEAANKMKHMAYHEFDLKSLNAITVKENISSQKLLDKLGMELKETKVLENDEEELLVYTLQLENLYNQIT